ncbi:hypothetical protein TIFTF001_001394 [Ficus carica]|uniref:TF-B3 domain-containing protein n=1 Tax=Ficus carica TaxID=3494 RepID=A0AA87YZQ9_FICCA|nr:hypothetical protein TIFTF001_001394 [Ficus carica]
MDRLIFQKSLKKTDVASRLSFPSKCLKKLPNFQGRHVVDFLVKDQRGSDWKFRCTIRKGSHPKPVLSGDWHKFAVSKGLRIGDEVKVFEEIDQATGPLLHYRVEVKKAVRLFGVSIEHAPPTVL